MSSYKYSRFPIKGTKRHSLCLFTIVCSFFCIAMFCSGCSNSQEQFFSGPVYATLQSSNAIEDLSTDSVFKGVAGAHYIAVSPNGKLLLVSSKNLPQVYLLDAHTGKKLVTFEIGQVAQGVTFSPDGQWGLAVSAGNGTVAVIDIKNKQMVQTISVGKVPHNALFAPDGKTAYVTLQGDSGVAVLDMGRLAKINEIPVRGIQGPHNLDLSKNGEILWVRDLVGNVAAVDVRTEKELAVIPVGKGHAGIDVIPGGKYVFTGAIADSVVDVIDPATFKVIKRINVGLGPHGVRASKDGHWVYVAVTGTNKVAVISIKTLKVVRQIPTQGKLPFWIAVPGND